MKNPRLSFSLYITFPGKQPVFYGQFNTLLKAKTAARSFRPPGSDAYIVSKDGSIAWTSRGKLANKPGKRTRKSNPRMVKIYDKITRIEGQKGPDSNFPGERFFHNFSKPYPAMYGTADKKTLIIRSKIK